VDCNRARGKKRERKSIEHSPLRASIESKKKTKERRNRTTTAESSIPVHIIVIKAAIETKKIYIHIVVATMTITMTCKVLKAKLFLAFDITEEREKKRTRLLPFYYT
jgi:hypothetical protein